MDDLRRLFAEMGFSDVETFIASGNVVFGTAAEDAGALEGKIAQRLCEALGYEVATFVRTTAEVVAIAQYKPFAEPELNAAGNTLYVAFLAREPGDESRRRLLSCASDVDDFHVEERQAYWLCRTKMSESKFSGALLERALGMRATVRNATTVRKIAWKYA